MTGKKISCCPTCGARTEAHKHSLSKCLISGLRKALEVADSYGRFDIAAAGLTNSERQNLSKLKYWGILKKQGDATGKGGTWIVAVKGLSFAEGNIDLPKSCRTYRDELLEFTGNKVNIKDLADGWRWRPDYARDARPFLDVPEQPELFHG